MKSLIRKCVREMKGYVPGEQPVGEGVIKLNTNENPYPPSPAVIKAVSGLKNERLRLYPDPDCIKLRKKIAGMHKCSIGNVFIGNGSDEIIALCARAFAENRGSIGYFDPSYSLYPVIAEMCGVKKRPLQLNAEFQAGPLPAGYDCSLFYLTNPNAPTGILHSRNKVRSLCKLISGVVLIDEAYVDFSRENFMDMALKISNVLVARSLSKSYSLAGLRIGYAVGPVDLIQALFKVKDSYNVDMISQVLALAAMGDIEYMRLNAGRIKATRERLGRVLAEMKFKVYPSEANFIWVRPFGISAADLFEQLRKERIFVRHFPGRRTGDYVRISIGTDAEIDKLIGALEKILS